MPEGRTSRVDRAKLLNPVISTPRRNRASTPKQKIAHYCRCLSPGGDRRFRHMSSPTCWNLFDRLARPILPTGVRCAKSTATKYTQRSSPSPAHRSCPVRGFARRHLCRLFADGTVSQRAIRPAHTGSPPNARPNAQQNSRSSAKYAASDCEARCCMGKRPCRRTGASGDPARTAPRSSHWPRLNHCGPLVRFLRKGQGRICRRPAVCEHRFREDVSGRQRRPVRTTRLARRRGRRPFCEGASHRCIPRRSVVPGTVRCRYRQEQDACRDQCDGDGAPRLGARPGSVHRGERNGYQRL